MNDSWMDRDHFQAGYVRNAANELGFEIVDVDGSNDVQVVAETIARKLGLAVF